MNAARFGRLLPAMVGIAGTVAAACAAPAAAQSRALRDSAMVESDGARLFVDLRAADSTAPVLLILHGGPGQVVSGLWSIMAYNGPGLERAFVVAYLNQRGVLKSPPVDPATQTVAQHVRDVDAVVRYLQTRFHRRTVHLLGHSWGTFLGWSYLGAHADRIGRFVAVAGGPNFLASEEVGYDRVLAWARRTGNAAAVAELTALGRPPYRDLTAVMVERKWSARSFGPGGMGEVFDMGKLLAAAGYTQADSSWNGAMIAVATRMMPELWTLDATKAFPSLRVPVLMIAGARDGIILAEGMRRGYRQYPGPKRYLEFEKGSHFLYAEEPDRFNRAVTGFLLGH